MTQMMPNMWTIILTTNILMMKLNMMKHHSKMKKMKMKLKTKNLKW